MQIVLALAAALAWGISDFGSGMKSRSVSALVVTLVVFVVGGSATTVIAASSQTTPGLQTLELAGIAGVSSAFGVSALFYALAIGEIGVVAPIVASGTSLPVIVGFVRGERPGLLVIGGIGLVVAGVITMVSVPGSPATTARDPRRGVVFACTASVLLGLYYVVGKAGARQHPVWYAALAQLSAATVLIVLLSTRRPSIPSRRDIKHLVALGLTNGAGWVCSVLALRRGLLALVSVLVSLYPAVTVLLAMMFAGERLTRLQYLAAAATLAGVAMIATG